MYDSAFPGVPIDVDRPTKPREQGITMMIDWSLPLGFQRDHLETNGNFYDLAKIAVGLPGLLPASVLRAKVDTYKENGVEPFPGGMFLEYALYHGADKAYWEGCQAAGFSLIEVSDNAIPLDASVKERLIREANELGMRVLGEVGSKHDITPIHALIEDISTCLAAGSWKVFIEAAELIDNGELRTDLIELIEKEFDVASVIWELPGIWIPGTVLADVHELVVYLLETLGANTNLANVMPEWVSEVETLRTGVGVRALAEHIGTPDTH